jgi:hypothetical protein
MNLAHRTTAAALGALLALSAAAPALAQQAGHGNMAEHQQILREAADRAAIEKLMWDYVAAIDGWNPDAYAAAFTEDGAFGATRGHQALRQMVIDLKKSQDDRRAAGAEIANMHHVMSNMNIEFVTPDHARVYYYHMTVFGQGLTPPPRVASVGKGMDDVVRVDGKWLIRSRNVAYQHPAPPGE